MRFTQAKKKRKKEEADQPTATPDMINPSFETCNLLEFLKHRFISLTPVVKHLEPEGNIYLTLGEVRFLNSRIRRIYEFGRRIVGDNSVDLAALPVQKEAFFALEGRESRLPLSTASGGSGSCEVFSLRA